MKAGFCWGCWAAWRGRGYFPQEAGSQLGRSVGEAAAESAAAGGITKPRAPGKHLQGSERWLVLCSVGLSAAKL